MAGKRSASRMMAQVASMAKKSKLDIANEEPLEKEESGEEYRARAAEFFQKESPNTISAMSFVSIQLLSGT